MIQNIFDRIGIFLESIDRNKLRHYLKSLQAEGFLTTTIFEGNWVYLEVGRRGGYLTFNGPTDEAKKTIEAGLKPLRDAE